MHKLKKAQSTCPVVNHAQDLHQSVIGVQLMFLARENKSLLFWLSVLVKNSAMKIDYLYFYSLFLFCFIPVTVHQQQKLSMKSNLTCKKGRYQQIIKTAQLYLLTFFTCTNKGHMKICYFLQTSQFKFNIIQIQMSEHE